MTDSTKQKREMKVLSLGLPRTGSASMAEALTILGYKNVYHGTHTIDRPEDWAIMERACDASFTNLPSYTGRPFTREEWDELWGHCEATTDVASIFAPQLIKAYPDAKVILAIRDFEPWFKSVDQSVLQNLWNPIAQFSINVLEPILGSAMGRSARKQMLGLFQASTVEEARANARDTYDRHHRVIKEMVPEGQLLEYRMGQGWGPVSNDPRNPHFASHRGHVPSYQNDMHHDTSSHTPIDAARAPPSALKKHLGEPSIEHDYPHESSTKRHSSVSHQEEHYNLN
ncbi:hypothetical protein FPOAC1_007792 [Fusarium poae]|uniref:hypothetical protein n=1 Tax=Fusarium poae TaxID=36050 RepID=UPI001CE82422|nr:hypothetical protein FPOAC1_007792 [Fusarium poae]KAG8668413.1 hypothetical protein FPOAC1_007792 [Fusarium poae]